MSLLSSNQERSLLNSFDVQDILDSILDNVVEELEFCELVYVQPKPKLMFLPHKHPNALFNEKNVKLTFGLL